MNKLVNLEKYPLDRLDSPAGQRLVAQCIDDLEHKGMFTLKGFMRREIIDEILPDLLQKFKHESFFHSREHNIYLSDNPPGIRTITRRSTALKPSISTLRGDQLGGAAACTLSMVRTDRISGQGNGQTQAVPDERSACLCQYPGLLPG